MIMQQTLLFKQNTQNRALLATIFAINNKKVSNYWHKSGTL